MGTPSNRASRSAGKAARNKNVNLDLNTAKRMLPLVRSIISDIVTIHRHLGELTPEQERLERNRRELDWNDRQRRYTLMDEIRSTEKSLSRAVNELNTLGLKLVDLKDGQVDFPTRINGRPAAFSWKFGESSLNFWHYAGEQNRRPIPADWKPGTPLRVQPEA